MKNSVRLPFDVIRLSALAFALFASQSALFSQGLLTPPGPPAPTMKTLDQLEPRTPLAQPGSFPILITQPGSYYLTANITATSNTDGIRVNVSGVTIDLNGFELVGTGAGSASSGIAALSAISNVTIRNGVVRAWGYRGLNLENAANARIEKMTVSGCADYGARTGPNALVHEGIFTGNETGLSADSGSVVSHSTASGNTGSGFLFFNGVSITACAAFQNGGTGIEANSGTPVSECSAFLNGGNGIRVTFGSSAVHCAAFANGADGIVGYQGSVIKDNSVYKQ